MKAYEERKHNAELREILLVQNEALIIEALQLVADSLAKTEQGKTCGKLAFHLERLGGAS